MMIIIVTIFAAPLEVLNVRGEDFELFAIDNSLIPIFEEI